MDDDVEPTAVRDPEVGCPQKVEQVSRECSAPRSWCRGVCRALFVWTAPVVTASFPRVLCSSTCRWAKPSVHRHHISCCEPPHVCHGQETGLSPWARACDKSVSFSWAPFALGPRSPELFRSSCHELCKKSLASVLRGWWMFSCVEPERVFNAQQGA